MSDDVTEINISPEGPVQPLNTDVIEQVPAIPEQTASGVPDFTDAVGSIAEGVVVDPNIGENNIGFHWVPDGTNTGSYTITSSVDYGCDTTLTTKSNLEWNGDYIEPQRFTVRGEVLIPFSPLSIEGSFLLCFGANLRWVLPDNETGFILNDLVVEIWVGDECVFKRIIGMIPGKWEVFSVNESIETDGECPVYVKFVGNFRGEIDVVYANIDVVGIADAKIMAKDLPNQIGEYSPEEENNDGRLECLFCDEPLERIYFEEHKGFYSVCPNCDKKGVENENREDGEHSSD